MKWFRLLLPVLVASVYHVPAHAQPSDLPIPPATTSEYPNGISVAKLPGGPVYVDAKGRTLYGMDMRTLKRFGPDPAQYCKDECARDWEPVLAEEGTKPNIAFPAGFSRLIQQALLSGKQFRPGGEPGTEVDEEGRTFYSNPQEAPDWTVIAGPQGPQWVYKGWHMVFTRKDEKPGSAKFEGAENMTWNTLKFVPPVPEIVAPKEVTTAFVDGAYVLADDEGRLLFTGRCHRECADWVPLVGGMMSREIGSWQVDLARDSPQWTYRGKPVFVSDSTDPALLPSGGEVLRP